MGNRKKIRIAILYGGRSGEHEVSLQSAASVIKNLDPEQYEILPVGIDKDGRWLLNDLSLIEKSSKELEISSDSSAVVLPPYSENRGSALVPFGGETGPDQPIDVVFPVMHGTFCEDGTIQGLLELADVPYVGAGVLGSAIGMDKDIAKRLVQAAGLPVAPYLAFGKDFWKNHPEEVRKQVQSKIQFPAFVKPANAGSSVGVVKVSDMKDLGAAIEEAFQWDLKILVEQGVKGREIELSVLENVDSAIDPLCSVPGEIIPTHEFYSYDAKYLDENGAKLEVPAKLSKKEIESAQVLGKSIFQTLELEGMARVDLFLEESSGQFFFNEVNTIPGFTQISMYPKLWEASGVSYKKLLDCLIMLAVKRHKRKSDLKRDWTE